MLESKARPCSHRLDLLELHVHAVLIGQRDLVETTLLMLRVDSTENNQWLEDLPVHRLRRDRHLLCLQLLCEVLLHHPSDAIGEGLTRFRREVRRRHIDVETLVTAEADQARVDRHSIRFEDAQHLEQLTAWSFDIWFPVRVLPVEHLDLRLCPINPAAALVLDDALHSRRLAPRVDVEHEERSPVQTAIPGQRWPGLLRPHL